MENDYEFIGLILSGERTTALENREEEVRLENEISACHRKMSALPTARESEALPDLLSLLRMTTPLVEEEEPALNELLAKDDTLREYIVKNLFEYVAYSVIKARIYNNKEIVRVADKLFCNLVVWATRQLKTNKKEYLSLLNVIINKGADYYKSNGKESATVYPFGEQLSIPEKHKEWVDNLEPGATVDCLKNYGGKKIWSKAEILSNDYNLIKVRYLKDNYDTYIQNKYFELAKLGSRESDFEWRESLKVGDEVDYYNIRKDWGRYTVFEVDTETNNFDEEVKMLKLQKKLEEDRGYEFDTLITIKSQSPAIAKPGKYSNSGEGIDDSDDEIYLSIVKQPKFAIMRSNSMYNTSSIYLIKYINLFGENKGFDFLLEALESNDPEVKNVLSEYIKLIQSSSDYLVAPFIKTNGEKMLEKIKEYILINTQQNLRDLSQNNLSAMLDGINCLSSRIYSFEAAKKMSDGLRLKIAILCIKSEFLEKQFFGAKIIGYIEMKLRNNDSDFSKADLARQLSEAGVFEKIVKGHSSLVGKSSGVLNILFTENAVNPQQLEFLWKEIGKTDVDSRNSLLSVLKDVIWNFSKEEIKFFVRAIKSHFEVLNDNEVFELLFALKRVAWNRHSDLEVLETVNEILWSVLQSNQNLKEDLKKEVIKNFVKCIIDDSERENEDTDIEQNDQEENQEPKKNYTSRVIDNILNGVNFTINLKILHKFLKHDSLLVYKIMDELKERKVISSIVEEIIKQLKNPQRIDSEDLKKKLKFIKKVTATKQGEKLLSFEEIEKVFKVVLDNEIQEESVVAWIKNYIKTKETDGDEFIRFFKKYSREFLKPGKSTFIYFLIATFLKINNYKGNMEVVELKLETIGITGYKNKKISKIRLKVPVEELEGYSDIWNIFIETNDLKMEKSLAIYLVGFSTISEFITDYDQELMKNEYENLYNKCIEMYLSEDANLNRKASAILELMMAKEELNGFGDLSSFASLKQGNKLVLDIEKNTKYFKERFKVSLFTNSTLKNVREMIADEYRMSFDVINIKVNTSDGISLDYNDNSKTLKELGLEMRDLLIVSEREMPEVKEKPLMNATGDEFSPEALLVFKEIFASYSEDGKMTKEHLAKFTSAATDGAHCYPSDDRVEGVFNTYDKEKNGYVTFENFHHFYLSSASKSDSKANTVRQNLLSLGYGKGLELKRSKFKSSVESPLRKRLMENEEFGEKVLERISSDDLSTIEESFINFMTPSISYINRVMENPLSELNKCVGNDNMLNYFLVILNSVTFNTKDFTIFNVSDSQQKDCLQKVFSKEFLDSLITKLSIVQINPKNAFLVKFLEKMIRLLNENRQANFVKDTNNFIAYFVKKKKKNNTSPKKNKNEITTQTGPSIGPVNKSDKEDDKEEEDKEPEVINLMKVFSVLDKKKLTKIVEELDFQKLNTTLISLILEQITTTETMFKHQKIVLCPGIISLLGSLIMKPTELDNLFAFKKSDFKVLLIKGLTHDKTMTRLFFKNFYAYLTSSISSLNYKTAFLRLVIETLKNDNVQEAYVILDLASNLLSELSVLKSESNEEEAERLHKEFDFGTLFNDFAIKLQNIESKEVSYESKEDSSLSSILIFMGKLLKTDDYILKEMPQIEREKLAVYILKNCLFDINSNNLNFRSIKCKTAKSRSAALELLKELTYNNSRTIINLMVSGFNQLSLICPNFTQGNSSSNSNKKSSVGFVGIRNPGCVCYMNAMLQQFYCIPAFRYTILMGQDRQEPDYVKIKDNYSIDDNVFHQLQRMFAFLDHSERYAYHPADFCASYKDYSGERVNIMVQQDTQEFLNMIFQKIENAIKPTPYFGMLNSVFAGTTCNVFTCQGCGFVRSNKEMFYSLSLEVKNLDNIAESWNKFTSQEIISDYMCDNCKKKCDVTKQCFLKDLPNVLVIHLQKIIFDMETLMNIKIASRFEFKKEMNLKDFIYVEPKEKKDGEEEDLDNKTKEAKEEEDPQDYEYKLAGVVIHRGNAEFGHYTSLINVNRKDPNRNIDEDLWLDFDDSRVTKFNMENFEEECFGAEDKEISATFPTMDHNISKSAYILVYDKVKKTDITFKVDKDHIEEVDRIKDALIDKNDLSNEGEIYRTGFYNLGKYIGEEYFNEVENDNNSLILEQQLLSSKFCNTFADIVYNNEFPPLISEYEISEVPNKYQLTLANIYLSTLPRFLFKIYCASNDNYRINKVLKMVQHSLVIQKDNSFNFFRENIVPNQEYLLNLLVYNSDSLVRNSVSEFFSFSILIMAEKHDLKLNTDNQLDAENATERELADLSLQRVIDRFINIIPAANPNSSEYRKFGAFFNTLFKVMEKNSNIAFYVFKSNVLKRLYDLYQCQEPSRIITHEKSLTGVLSIIDLLLRIQKSCEENGMEFNLSFESYRSVSFLEKIMKEDYRFNNYEALKKLVILFCTDNQRLTEIICKLALNGLAMSPDIDAIAYLECLYALLMINDKLTYKRIPMVLGYPRLSDCKTNDHTKNVYIYGLAKENSLKKAVFNFKSNFDTERGMLEELQRVLELNESCALLIIFYVLEISLQLDNVLDYLLKLPMGNYISNSIFDFYRNYVRTQLNSFQNSYNAPKADLQYFYFSNLEDKMNAFEVKVREKVKEMVEKKLINVANPDEIVVFGDELKKPSFSIYKNYIIGRTLSCKLIKQITLQEIDDKPLYLNVTLIRVSLMENSANGVTSLTIPKDVIAYDFYINKRLLDNKEFEAFIGSGEEVQAADEDMAYSLKALADADNEISDDDDLEAQVDKPVKENKLSFFDSDYILRISVDNKTDSHFFIKFLITGNNNVSGEEIMIPVRMKKYDTLVHNLYKKDPFTSFGDIEVSVKLCPTESINTRYYNEQSMSDYKTVYKHE